MQSAHVAETLATLALQRWTQSLMTLARSPHETGSGTTASQALRQPSSSVASAALSTESPATSPDASPSDTAPSSAEESSSASLVAVR
jgi:hypothetical protein